MSLQCATYAPRTAEWADALTSSFTVSQNTRLSEQPPPSEDFDGLALARYAQGRGRGGECPTHVIRRPTGDRGDLCERITERAQLQREQFIPRKPVHYGSPCPNTRVPELLSDRALYHSDHGRCSVD
jgi:hypothetical protein